MKRGDMTMHKIKFPVLDVKMIPINKIHSNDYNPNKVASPELKLLEHSIIEDGFTQPIVCFYEKTTDQYIIVDGFHRYTLAKKVFRLQEVPVTVLKKERANRIASTVRHNRARGKHAILGMVNLLEELVGAGWSEEKISKELGMDKEEVIRLKQSTGLKKMFANHTFSESWSEFEERYYDE